jgi:hypothetical protein
LNLRPFSTTYAWLGLFVIALIIVVCVGWANLQFVNSLPQESSFFFNWKITRDFIFNGENPYNNQTGDPFISPLPVVIFFSPFALIGNFPIARAAWITVLQFATAIFAILCIRIPSWKVRWWWSGLLIVFALLWFPAFSVYVRGSYTALIAVLFGASLLSLKNQNDELAGILLGFAAIQPRVTFFVVVLILLWSASQKRWIVNFWTGVILIFLGGIGMIFLPSWPSDFFWSVLRNVDLKPGNMILETTTNWWPGVGLQIGWGFLIIAFIILIAEWWLVMRKGEKHLIWVIGLSLILATWLGIGTNLDHIYMLLLILSIIFVAWNRKWGFSGQIFFIFVIFILLSGLWSAFYYFAQQGIQGELNPVLMIGFPLLTMFGLYWIRWWFIRPSWLDEEAPL